jgi:hypothetical protein
MATASRSHAPSETSSYRRVGKQSHVDESLFGKQGKHGNTSSTAQSSQALASTKPGQMSAEVVALTKSELNRMLSKPPVLSAAEAQALKQETVAAREKERAAANAHKARMLELEEAKKKQVMMMHLHRLCLTCDVGPRFATAASASCHGCNLLRSFNSPR